VELPEVLVSVLLLNTVFGVFWGAAKQKSRISCKIVLNYPLFIVIDGKINTKRQKMKKNSAFVIDFIRFLVQNGRKMLNY
jgi:hypothetical protein